MSVKVLSIVFDGFPRGGSEYLAMIVLADWSNDDGMCFPSMASIARKMRVSKSQSQRVVHKLIDDGFVSVIKNHFGGDPGETRHYQINLAALTGRIGATGSVDTTGGMDAQEGSHGCGGRGSIHATQTVIEPSLTVNGHFAVFWNAYPKKKNKGDAENAFKALKVDGNLLENMLSALADARQSKDWQKEKGQFIPYPATWLRAKGWEDEIQVSHVAASDGEVTYI